MAIISRDAKQYDSGDVTVVIDGVVEDEVTEITYKTTQAHQKNFTLKNKATSWSMGQIDDNASIGLMMTAIRKIETAAGGNIIKIAPFFINISFVNEFNVLVNDTLLVKFMDQGRTVTGQMGLSQVYELFVLDADYNNV